MEIGELKKRFGKKVQALREANGMTQEEVADRIGRSVDTVSNIERGINATRIETASQLADALGVPLPSLFDLSEPIEPALAHQRHSVEAVARLLESRDDETVALVRKLVEVALQLVDKEGSVPEPTK